MLADLIKTTGGKFDCLKGPDIFALEQLDYSTFHLLSLLFLACAVLHTLFVNKIHQLARYLEIRQAPKRLIKQTERSFGVQVLYFFAEVEIVFALWAIPLFFTIVYYYGWTSALDYINTRDYTEALFVVLILSISFTKPIIQVSNKIIQFLARGLGGTLSAWWFTLLTVGPILGSFITEAGAMAISATLLSKQFFHFRPSSKLSYVTLALLFTNISVGGVLTNFASPVVLVLSHAWHWTNWEVFSSFGWKATIGIVISNSFYWFYFRKEFAILNQRRLLSREVFNVPPEEEIAPWWVTGGHLFFMLLIVLTSHYPAIFMASYLFFVGFYKATRRHQCSLKLTRPLLVGLFLAGLVIHGGLQGWWVVRALQDLSPLQVLGMAMGLTAFNDNTAIGYLATLIPDWTYIYQYALFTGLIAGGGLTVIANAPNPAGFVILSKHFEGGVSAWKLVVAAFLPALILYILFTALGPLLIR